MKKVNQFFLIVAISFYLFGCSTTYQSATNSPDITPSIVPVSNTPTLFRNTPHPTRTRQPTQPPPTPVQIPKSTFDPSQAVFQTPLPAAQCSPDTTGVVLPDLETLNQNQEFFETTIVEALNLRGTRDVVQYLSQDKAFTIITRADLTHDKVPELIVSNFYPHLGYLSVFGCDTGQYKKLLTVDAVFQSAPRVLSVKQYLSQS